MSIGAQPIQLEKMVVDIFVLREESKNQKIKLERMEKMIMEMHGIIQSVEHKVVLNLLLTNLVNAKYVLFYIIYLIPFYNEYKM